MPKLKAEPTTSNFESIGALDTQVFDFNWKGCCSHENVKNAYEIAFTMQGTLSQLCRSIIIRGHEKTQGDIKLRL